MRKLKLKTIKTMLKVGDKLKAGERLLCKKSYYNVKKNKYYEILQIYGNIIQWIYVDDYYFNRDNYFNLNKHSFYYIWNFFYTPQELRKLKLKQLNETKSR